MRSMPGSDEERRWFDAAGAERWNVPQAVFAEALQRSAAKAFVGREPPPAELERYVASLHLTDLALACACALGDDAAWECLMREHRPALYRAADGIDPSGGARDLADALWAELWGLKGRDGDRPSLFRYFHGRSSLDTWMRAVLSQRYVDRLRAARRLEPLPDDASPSALHAPSASGGASAPDRRRFAALMQGAMAAAVAALGPRDRLRLGCYYAQDMTLAQIGRLLGEHEGTVSRHLTRTRRTLRDAVEHELRVGHGLGDQAVRECFTSVTQDAGSMNLTGLMEDAGKKPGADRSTSGDMR